MVDRSNKAFLRNGDLPDLKDLKCFTACQLSGMNMMTKDGYIDWDKMIAFKKSVLVDPSTEKKIIEAKEHCLNIELPGILKGGEDICKKTYEVLNCYYRNARRLNIKTVDEEVTS